MLSGCLPTTPHVTTFSISRTSDRLPLRSCAYRGARESCSGRAFSACLRHRWGPLGICNSLEGQGRKYISCRTKNATSTLKHRLEAVPKVALVFVQSQRPVYARIRLTSGRQRQKLPPGKSGHSGVAQQNGRKKTTWRCRRDPWRPATALLASQKNARR